MVEAVPSENVALAPLALNPGMHDVAIADSKKSSVLVNDGQVAKPLLHPLLSPVSS